MIKSFLESTRFHLVINLPQTKLKVGENVSCDTHVPKLSFGIATKSISHIFRFVKSFFVFSSKTAYCYKRMKKNVDMAVIFDIIFVMIFIEVLYEFF